jgi:oligoendopeptidase F
MNCVCGGDVIIATSTAMSARALPRQQPAWVVPRGIPFRDQFRDHLARSWKKYTSMTKNVLVMEKFHFYDQNDRLVMVDQM